MMVRDEDHEAEAIVALDRDTVEPAARPAEHKRKGAREGLPGCDGDHLLSPKEKAPKDLSLRTLFVCWCWVSRRWRRPRYRGGQLYEAGFQRTAQPLLLPRAAPTRALCFAGPAP